MDRAETFIQTIRTEFPRFKIVPKRGHLLSHAIDFFLKIITLGGQSEYMTRYHTVLGDTLYVPPTWETMPDTAKVILLRHERVHLRQRRRYGQILMAFLYLVPFFPIGLAYGRARIEWEAYEETLRATAELCGLEAARDPALRREIIGRFVGPAYGYMWPFKNQVNAWYDDVLKTIATTTDAVFAGTDNERRESSDVSDD